MKDAAARIANYNARMVSSLIDPAYAARSTEAQANFATFATAQTNYQTDVASYLDIQGVKHESWFQYNAFAGEMYHVKSISQGAAAVAQATAIYNKVLFLGLSDVHMKAIANDVFGIVIP
jgi:uncharacterized protein YaiE (UPF0345 family)